MNCQQLRAVRETVRQGFNLTQAAEALHTSQPGVSRQIKELEDELGAGLFVRAGRRILGLTPTGELALPLIERLQQGSPRQIAEQVLNGSADIGIATEALAEYPELIALPCYRWSHVVVPRGHALAEEAAAGGVRTLERLAQFPLVTYEPGYTGRRHVDEAFARAGLAVNVVLSAMDAEVIQTYVDLRIGVGIVASVAFDEARDTYLVALAARHLFALNTPRVAIKRGAFLRAYVHGFIQTFAPTLTREVIAQALETPPGEVIER